jgi:protein-tyrosine-phosphatase
MAEGFLKKMLKEKLNAPTRIQVLSAGLNAFGGLPTKEATEIMKREGIDISGFRSKRLSEELVDKADLILTMEKNHKDTLLSLLPQHAHKIFTLKEFAGETENLDIDDPYNRGLKTYETCAEEIKLVLAKVFDKIVNCMLEEEEKK